MLEQEQAHSLPFKAESIQLRGVVQGVGMRPYIFSLANRFALSGWVNNNGKGVEIIVEGSAENLENFKRTLIDEAPPLSKIEHVFIRPIFSNQKSVKRNTPTGFFEIRESDPNTTVETTLSSDAAICEACARELNDNKNRRWRYPFTNCTHCGPRFSIAEKIPFDRENTSMVEFPLCDLCQSEYENPLDRRFHAQAICCPQCGPQLAFVDAQGGVVERWKDEDEIKLAARLLNDGKIIAIKGLGGFHLACKANIPDAINLLRKRKSRPSKPFALMALNIEQIKRYAEVTENVENHLKSVQAPIVLLNKLNGELNQNHLPEELAPGQGSLGFMLPYTPLHLLLMQEMDAPLVMTSGNTYGAPQCIGNGEALEKLGNIADYFLMHDRRIVHRVDDSVIKVSQDKEPPSIFRRARGYAPELLPERLDIFQNKTILAMGGEQKNTLCWIKNNRPLVSTFIGDLYQVEVFQSYLDSIQNYEKTFHLKPAVIAVDKHPSYHSSIQGAALAETRNIPIVRVQHHHAHIASCLLENNFRKDEGKVLGIVLDGSGYGDDETVWGGEFILADYKKAERCGHFQKVALAGGEQAVREPWRNAYAHLEGLGWEALAKENKDLDLIKALNDKPLALIQTLIDRQLNSPLTSSAGRVFDAAAAILGLCFEKISFEGEAAMQLEALALEKFTPENTESYEYNIQNNIIDWRPMWLAILKDLKVGTLKSDIAARFHQTVAKAVCELAIMLCQEKCIATVALSGGVFQNGLLLQACLFHFETAKLRVLRHKLFPANDSGIALGQAAIAAQQIC